MRDSDAKQYKRIQIQFDFKPERTTFTDVFQSRNLRWIDFVQSCEVVFKEISVLT